MHVRVAGKPQIPNFYPRMKSEYLLARITIPRYVPFVVSRLWQHYTYLLRRTPPCIADKRRRLTSLCKSHMKESTTRTPSRSTSMLQQTLEAPEHSLLMSAPSEKAIGSTYYSSRRKRKSDGTLQPCGVITGAPILKGVYIPIGDHAPARNTHTHHTAVLFSYCCAQNVC